MGGYGYNETLNIQKGGDSGSPNLLPIGDALWFTGGRSTTGPDDQWIADLATLNTHLGLATNYAVPTIYDAQALTP